MWNDDPITESPGMTGQAPQIDLPALLRPPPKPLPKELDVARGVVWGVMLGAEMWAVIAVIAVSCAVL